MEKSSESEVKSLKEAMDGLQDYMDEKYPNVWNAIMYLEDETKSIVSHTFFGYDDGDDVEGFVNAIMHIVNNDVEVAERLFVELGDLLISAGKMQPKAIM